MRKILLIEDNLGDVELTKSALEELDMDIELISFQEGQTAWDYLYTHHKSIDLILLDLNLPKISGFELLLKLRKYGGVTRLPTIVFSTSNAQRDVHKAYELGANAYVVKPGKFSDFKKVIKEICHFWLFHVTLAEHNESH